MKLFRIFAVGILLSAVVVSTALAPIGNAAQQQAESFSSKLFSLPNFDITDFTILDLNYTDPSTTTTGPSSDPPEADVVPNFSGLVVNGPTAIDSDDDDTDDLIIDENGKIFINNRLEVDADGDGDEEFLVSPDLMILGEYPGGPYMLVSNFFMIETEDPGFFTVQSPNVKFAMPTGASGDVDFEIEGNLQVDGTIQTASTIGTRYINSKFNTGYSVTVSCDSDHDLTGCSGWSWGSGQFKGTFPDGIACQSKRSTSGGIWAYANCFDPSGITDPGTYDLTP